MSETVRTPTPGFPDPGTGIALQVEEREVDWQSASLHTPFDLQALEAEARERVAQSTVPVLLPEQSSNGVDLPVNRLVLSIGRGFYAADLGNDGVEVVITGSRRHAVIPGVPNVDVPVYGDHQRGVTRAEGITELDFMAYGVSYNISLECIARDDLRCSENDYIIAIADSLQLATANGKEP